ncbi:GNAT family N-acetyltransferase [Bdellovibrio sp. SKB1291214]|uniref:GNAT family N-acetyltransferase n=1 Tax=Bdellovibrio sp. SKB1291214 TaxID=1732569 RepID=UPI000B51C5C0|nr:GNAT family N-acetyltransferase [Bdellovibrio sp. SKB1291214]UYL08609.1 GNAT family N-acetyltransferase [Bdellovibrio sp. SKB1291214]
MHIEFTQADESHVEELVELINSAYRGESSKQGWTTEADLLGGQRADEEGISEIIERDNSVILIAEDDDTGQLLGCVHLENHGGKCYVGMLTVDPTLQGQGIGKMLLEESEAFAQFWGCTHLYMTVISVRTELVKFYEKQGFKLTGEKKPFPYGDERFGIPKVQNLEFVVMERKLS